ncbi:MAG: DNA polymerase III subunit epsilon [Sinimarinibacterium flocculans]|uniref:DNA polymerase III subunit epsilon n=1 Tax=Sinimarinibacterium flocculans TaxID=985250 RepID=UPI003C3D1D2D
MEERLVVLDIETTGMSVEDGHRIIEIGCVELVARHLTGRDFHRRIDPSRVIEPSASAVHGIHDADVAHEPQFADIADAFLDYVDGATLVIHNAAFDLTFLDMELKCFGRPPMRTLCSIVHTLLIARLRHPGQRNSPDALCRRYAIDARSRAKAHGALIDASLLAEVYLAMPAGQSAMAFDEHRPVTPKKSRLLASLASSAHRSLPVTKATKDEAKAHESRMHAVH